MKHIDLRSDTATLPTEEMMKAMNEATFGDDILGEDPTVVELEKIASLTFGMEDAMLVISGTMANQIAVMAMTNRGQEAIMGQESHLFNLEVSGLATLSQVQARTVPVLQGHYDINTIEEAIYSKSLQTAETGVICLENTYNLNEGAVVTLENMTEIKALADQYQIPVYLDGARLFNAAASLDVKSSIICQSVDAVQICLTKGLGCPLGSLLLGSKSFIREAKRIRQRLGGGMRQPGIIAAPAIIALTTMTDKVNRDNQLASELYNGLNKIPGIKMNSEQCQSNIVSIEVVKESWNADKLIRKLKANDIYVKKIGLKKVRMVTHYQISRQDIDKVLKQFQFILG